MTVRKYKNGDKVPVFIHVLDMCAYFYAQIAIKIAVIDHYQELKGFVEKKQLNQSLLIIIKASVKSITVVLDEIAYKQSINLTEYLGADNRILRLSSDIYWCLVLDEFPCSIDKDDAATADYLEMHHLYSLSLLSILKGLYMMFCNGEIDLNNFFDLRNCQTDFWLNNKCDEKHLPVLVKLLQLNNQLQAYQEEMRRHELDFNLNGMEITRYKF